MQNNEKNIHCILFCLISLQNRQIIQFSKFILSKIIAGRGFHVKNHENNVLCAFFVCLFVYKQCDLSNCQNFLIRIKNTFSRICSYRSLKKKNQFCVTQNPTFKYGENIYVVILSTTITVQWSLEILTFSCFVIVFSCTSE